MFCPDSICSGEPLPAQKDLSIFRQERLSITAKRQVRKFRFGEQKNSYFLAFDGGVYNFEESPQSIQDFFGDFLCPGK